MNKSSIRALLLTAAAIGATLTQTESLATEHNTESSNNREFGYLTAPSLSPGHVLRPSSMFSYPDIHPAGSWNIGTDFHWANVWAYEPDRYLIDCEWIRCNTRICYALNNSTSLGILIPVMGRWGGVADQFIEEFHSVFGMDNDDRQQMPQDQSIISYVSNGATQTIARGESWGIGDTAFFAAYRRDSVGNRPAVILQGQLSLPTGDADEMQGLGNPSLSVSALVSKRLRTGPVLVFGGFGLVYCRADKIAGIRLRNDEWSGLLGVAYECSPTVLLIIQNLSSSPVAKNYAPFSDACHELSIGFKWQISASFALEFGLTENVATFDNSADFGAHFSFTLPL
ncbi:MAG: DUF3187 family protein [Lentisphaerae bacterium]|nr:DUF3187 family protein [Lentisphaerota bacterium]